MDALRRLTGSPNNAGATPGAVRRLAGPVQPSQLPRPGPRRGHPGGQRRRREGEATRDAASRPRGSRRGRGPARQARVRARDPEAADRWRRRSPPDGEARSPTSSSTTSTGIMWPSAAVIGRSVPLEAEVRDGLGTGQVVSASPVPWSGTPNASATRTASSRSTSRAARGRPFVFEAYTPPRTGSPWTARLPRELLPLGLGGLLLFQLAVLPLAWSLARRRASAPRGRSWGRSFQAWHVERRRLAHELHDGVIQDLCAAGYAMPTVLERCRPGPRATPPAEVAARALFSRTCGHAVDGLRPGAGRPHEVGLHPRSARLPRATPTTARRSAGRRGRPPPEGRQARLPRGPRGAAQRRAARPGRTPGSATHRTPTPSRSWCATTAKASSPAASASDFGLCCSRPGRGRGWHPRLRHRPRGAVLAACPRHPRRAD